MYKFLSRLYKPGLPPLLGLGHTGLGGGLPFENGGGRKAALVHLLGVVLHDIAGLAGDGGRLGIRAAASSRKMTADFRNP